MSTPPSGLPKPEIPLIDYHVHLSQELSLQHAAKLAQERKMRFGVVAHPGPDDGLITDADLTAYVERLHAHGVLAGLQPMYRGWAKQFSDDALSALDYILMDADSVPWDGDYLYLWHHDHFIADVDLFVERYLDHIVHLLANEPIDIFGRPTFLPVSLARHYDEIWTPERMLTIIELAKANNIALEIAEQVRVPNLEFIQTAQAAGVKFTFGTNARNQHAGDFHYCLEIAAKAGLTAEDMLTI